mmetsp:Transcript_110828/g.320312  ORF Transcript_110828/g.320312 Transcript_110828/m.320312 type:complete len:185 (-) Transcript_110828:190-744(-)
MALMQRSFLMLVGLLNAAALSEIDDATLADELNADEECLANTGGFEGECSLNMLQRLRTRVIEAPAPREAAFAEAGANMTGASADGGFMCGAALCASDSICCQSRDINAALCCAPFSVCYFSAYNYEAGVRILNQLGLGSPRCYACNEKEDGCKNRKGGSKYYGPLPKGTKDVEGLPPVAEIPQ